MSHPQDNRDSFEPVENRTFRLRLFRMNGRARSEDLRAEAIGSRERGFTMVEILVVMAITVILMGLIFGPLISSFNFVSRGRITAQSQEAARSIIDTLNREVKDAIQVSISYGDRLILPQDDNATIKTTGVKGLGFIFAYDENGKRHTLTGALLDFVPADDTLGLHGGNLSNPPIPQVTAESHTHEAAGNKVESAKGIHNIVVRYFVGLRDPGYPHTNAADRYSPRQSNSEPIWTNGNVQTDVLGRSDFDNTYILYRIEFDAEDPAYANWKLDPNVSADLSKLKSYVSDGFLSEVPKVPVINPNFFYDSETSANGEPFWANWRRNAQAVSPIDNIDLVRFIADPNNSSQISQALSTVTFTPTVIQNDPAVPVAGQEGSPVSYVATHGNWTGLQNDGTLTATQMNPPALGVYPHILVYETAVNKNGAQGLNEVYNNWNTTSKDTAYPDNTRVLTWDSRTGAIRFSAGSLDTASNQTQQVQVQTVMTPSLNGWDFDPVALAIQQNKLKIPNSLKKYIRIVPGSETVSITYVSPNILGQSTSSDQTRTDIYRRSASSQVMDTAPQPSDWKVSQYGDYPTALPDPGSYFFDSTNGQVILGFPWPGPNNPQRPQPIPHTIGNQSPQVTIRFSYQTNLPADVVRVDYATRSLLHVSMGIRAFDPSTGRLILTQLTDKIALRNMGR